MKVETTTKRRCNAVAGLVFGIFGLLWLLAIPNYPFLIIGPAAYFLKAAPIWHVVYWPIVALSIASIFEARRSSSAPAAHMVSAHFPYRHDAAVSAWIVNALLHTQTYVLPANQDVAGAGRNPEYLHPRQRGYLGGVPGRRPGRLWLAGLSARSGASMQPATPHLA